MEIKRIIFNDKHSALYILYNGDNGYRWKYIAGTHDSNSIGYYPRIRTNDFILRCFMPFYEWQLYEHST